jgi:putative iron-dependent peroxidase
MLERMFLGDPPARHDRILDFSVAVTGNLFFVPSADFLDDLPDPPTIAAALPVEDETRVGRRWPESLGIGDLRGSEV